MTEPPPHGGRVLYGGLRGVGWTPLAHALRCCTQRPNRGPAGRRPPGVWGRGAGRRAWGRGYGWHRARGYNVTCFTVGGLTLRGRCLAPSIRRGRAAQGYGCALNKAMGPPSGSDDVSGTLPPSPSSTGKQEGLRTVLTTPAQAPRCERQRTVTGYAGLAALESALLGLHLRSSGVPPARRGGSGSGSLAAIRQGGP